MKKALLVFLLAAGWIGGVAQTLTISAPAGLEEPYEVEAGTEVTFTLESFNPPTVFFYSTTAPVFPDFGVDDSWVQRDDFTDNGDGTYSLTLTVSETAYVWTGEFSSWISQWLYSNIIQVDIASGVKITATDGLLCDTPGNTETLTTQGIYSSYQWYLNNEPIDGAITPAFAANEPGRYKVQVPLDDKLVFSNTIWVKRAEVSFTGSFDAANKLTLTASAGVGSYQWLSGSSAGALTPVGSANSSTYTATLGSPLVYYSVRGTLAGCAVQAEARAANLGAFTVPVITVDAPTNGYGKTCVGTEATLSVPDGYGTYQWYNNGAEYFETSSTLSVYEDLGTFQVNVTPASWPEITLSSGDAQVNYLSVIEPQLTGVDNYGYYCPGESLSVTLSDEGYTYTWYAHTSFNYTEDDKVDVTGYTYTFTFEEPTYITVVAEFLGCESTGRLYLNSTENATLFLEVSDQNQLYLCPGSSAVLSISAEDAANYENFQWYKASGETLQPIGGQTTSSYTVTAVGSYVLKAHPKSCPATVVESDPREFMDSSERVLNIYADKTTLCEGEETTLSIPEDWTNIQWFKKGIIITSTGYQGTWVPLPGAGTTTSQVVSEYTTYAVKAKHVSCPTGLKTTSEPIQITPTINPTITPEPETLIYGWHEASYDSIPSYIYCEFAPVALHLPETYSSVKWYTLLYNGDDDYSLGDEIPGETTTTLTTQALGASWYTAKVEENGCVGFSHPVLIDTWVHNTPDISSQGNSELCEEGDSTLLKLGFPGNWVKFEWYKDGELLPDSDNDSLWAREPGGYTISGYPSECPNIEYNSGLPVYVTMYPQATIEENEEVIYAMPEFGFYEYQWYLDGEPVEPEDLPWVRYKATMLPGTYTVKVTNPEECSSMSDGYVWTVTGIEDEYATSFKAYPNPTPGKFTVSVPNEGTVQSINVYDLRGRVIQQGRSAGESFDLSAQPAGVYVVELILRDGSKRKLKVIRS